MTKNELRKGLKALGYKCSFNVDHNPFSGGRDVEFLTLIFPDGLRIMLTSATIMSAERYEQNKAALQLCSAYQKGGLL